jgi:hypothetical protein
MANEDWKLQVSYTIPNGPMINVRAQSADELSVLLEGAGDYSTQIAAVQSLIKAAFITAPLVTLPITLGTEQSTNSAPPQASAPYATAPVSSQLASSGPVCVHGARKYKSGISSKTGNPYAMWVCPQPQTAPDQCKPVN